MLCHGRSTGLRLAPGTMLAVEGANTAANDHEIAMDVVPAARCLVILFFLSCLFHLVGGVARDYAQVNPRLPRGDCPTAQHHDVVTQHTPISTGVSEI